MTAIALDTMRMIEMLPETEQQLINEMVKRFFVAWDPDFTKLTPEERRDLELAELEADAGEIVSHEEINWD